MDAPAPDEFRRLPILGVPVVDCSMDDALERVRRTMDARHPRATSIYFVNAHTLNCACEDAEYLGILRRGDCVFGDGTGVRWAARILHGRRLKDNVNGTDMVPKMLRSFPGRDYAYFLLGNTPERIERAARYARENFPGWRAAGHHHGYVDDEASRAVVSQINASAADVLLVGMGNPRQERWIDRHIGQLSVPLCIGVGGLFDYWSGDLDRAPAWIRRLGYEWLHILLRQPYKLRRYALGNPAFLARVLRDRVRPGRQRDGTAS